jgi:hypothetical protein
MSIYIFGDSFIGPFKLFQDNNLKIHKFTGATAKGLLKQNNPNRQKIISLLTNNKDISCAIFNFGQVDIYFSYFYKKYVKKERFMMDSLAKKYIEFIKSINCNNCQKIVMAIYPPVVEDKYMLDSLVHYNILTKDMVASIPQKEKEKVSTYKE